MPSRSACNNMRKMLLMLAVICETASVTSLVHRTYYIVVDLLLCNIVSRYFSTNMVMLKGIPRVISPQLLSVLSRMGHGDEIVLADANFPTASVCAKGPEMVRADGHDIPTILKAVLQLLPLDAYVPKPAAVMQVVPSDAAKGLKTPIWGTYQTLLNEAESKTVEIEEVERFAFYDRAKTAFAVVHTGETALYGNIILKKGVL